MWGRKTIGDLLDEAGISVLDPRLAKAARLAMEHLHTQWWEFRRRRVLDQKVDAEIKRVLKEHGHGRV